MSRHSSWSPAPTTAAEPVGRLQRRPGGPDPAAGPHRREGTSKEAFIYSPAGSPGKILLLVPPKVPRPGPLWQAPPGPVARTSRPATCLVMVRALLENPDS